ncbi:hypothetical protein OS493_032609 [Desmophyllum pertusum]|uniref:Uncharacterized protein n=1 Tax=Desmophyllum pertusum TaxID=174260 RepID=A0A9W9YKQ5_9CNID|nr:hypothetical protein OS493_032609 [Desmophyllum pertusum]
MSPTTALHRSLKVSWTLIQLGTLNVARNYLQELPSGMFRLKRLTALILSSNQLNGISEDIINLNQLTTLELSENRLEELPRAICNLPMLTTLVLSSNKLKGIPENIVNLAHLTTLELSDNRLEELPQAIFKLEMLTTLTLSSNQLRRINEDVVNLEHLATLELSSNSLEELPEAICHLKGLTELDVSGNQLKTLPLELVTLRNLNRSKLNTILCVLLQLRFASKDYQLFWPTYKLLEKDKHVIRSGAGKTSLANTLAQNKPSCVEEKDRTIVLDMIPWEIDTEDTLMVVSMIDFGGDDIYKINGKVVPTDWLEIYNGLQNSEVTGNQPFMTFDAVKQLVDSKNQSVLEKFKRFFESKDERTKTILSFFHNIGVLLWYQHSEELKKFVFHRAEFLTEVIKVVFSDKVATGTLTFGGSIREFLTSDSFEETKQDLLRRGIMSRTLLKGLWRDHQIEEDVFDAMIDLFTHLDLCYPMPNEGHEDALRFPWFLTDDVPDVACVKKLMHEAPCLGSNRLSLKYVYPAMCPTPLYHNFVVRLHRHIHDLKSRHDWRDGVYAHVKESQVLVHKATRGTESFITVSVEGLDLLQLWSILLACHEELTHLMTQWPGLRWECWIVCPHCTRVGITEPGIFPSQIWKNLSAPKNT